MAAMNRSQETCRKTRLAYEDKKMSGAVILTVFIGGCSGVFSPCGEKAFFVYMPYFY